MDHFEQRELLKTGDTSPEAIHVRLVAMQKASGLSGKDLAKAAGIKYTTYKSQEKSGSPSVRLMTYYLEMFNIDYNFTLSGDASRLPHDRLEAILAALS